MPPPPRNLQQVNEEGNRNVFGNHTGVFPRGLAVSVRYSVVETVSHGALCAPLWVMREEREMMDKCPVLF